MIPVPGWCSAQQNLAGAVTAFDIMVQRAAFAQWNTDHATLGRFGCLADRFRHFARLAVTKADPAFLVTHNDERRKTEALTTLHCFRDAVDVNQLIDEFAFFFVAIVTITGLALCHVSILLVCLAGTPNWSQLPSANCACADREENAVVPRAQNH
jgi:hypothetical protein